MATSRGQRPYKAQATRSFSSHLYAVPATLHLTLHFGDSGQGLNGARHAATVPSRAQLENDERSRLQQSSAFEPQAINGVHNRCSNF